MARFSKRYADTVARLRVPGGFLLVGAFAWLSSPDAQSLSLGIPVSIAGLVLRGWAAGHLRKNTSLAMSGPYAWVRNPLYLGTLIVAAGLVIASQRWELAVLFALVFAFVYFPVIELEEQHLRKLFPDFERYCQLVPMLWPSGRKTESRQHFEFSQYWRNEEYNAVLGFVAGLVLLLWKAA